MDKRKIRKAADVLGVPDIVLFDDKLNESAFETVVKLYSCIRAGKADIVLPSINLLIDNAMKS